MRFSSLISLFLFIILWISFFLATSYITGLREKKNSYCFLCFSSPCYILQVCSNTHIFYFLHLRPILENFIAPNLYASFSIHAVGLFFTLRLSKLPAHTLCIKAHDSSSYLSSSFTCHHIPCASTHRILPHN